MMRTAAGAVMGLAVIAGAADAHASGASITVRLADRAGVSQTVRARAAVEADAILRQGGIDVTWTDCSDEARQPEVCRTPLSQGAVIVRLLPHGGDERERTVSMGYALVKPSASRPVLATVYVDLVNRVARQARVDATALLGRAIAHEIGHLLLNSNSHAPAGLMRATWSIAQLRRNAPADWRFDEDQRQAMRIQLETAVH